MHRYKTADSAVELEKGILQLCAEQGFNHIAINDLIDLSCTTFESISAMNPKPYNYRMDIWVEGCPCKVLLMRNLSRNVDGSYRSLPFTFTVKAV